MQNNLLEFNGIDSLDNVEFKWSSEDKVSGNIDFKNKNLLGSTIDKEILSCKIIDSFEDLNNDGLEIFNNILLLNAKFNLSIEYSEENSYGKLNLLHHKFYKTTFISLSNYDFSNIDKEILIPNYVLTQHDDKIYYNIDILIGVNEL